MKLYFHSVAIVVMLAVLHLLSTPVLSGQPINIGSRRELFVDRLLADRMEGVSLRLHRPTAVSRPKSPLPDHHYLTVLKDRDRSGPLLRAYWRENDPDYSGPRHSGHAGEIVCYAESRDGHEWAFPKLGLHKISGRKDNNVILARMPPLLHNFTPFLDTRPGVRAEERYKALSGHPGPGDKRGKSEPGWGLFAFVSGDGVHWTKKNEVIPYQPEWRHAFDSQNVVFWSDAEQQYVCYFRTWTSPERLRSISRTTSIDFKKWTKPVAMNPNQPGEHLYTNQTQPYFRAPHIYIATPTRFVPDRGDAPEYDRKDINATDILFMSTRAGSSKYDRLFTEAFIRPGFDPARWRNRSNYVALNILPSGPKEMSIYHRSGDRYVLRTDGFISVNAGAQTGEFTTRPLVFSGSQLYVNLSTSAAGLLQVEMLDESDKAIPGFTRNDCPLVYGDSIDLNVKWKDGRDLAPLAGKPVKVRFVMLECDLFSFQFM